MVKSKNLLGNKVLLLLAFVLFAIGFSIINNVFLVFGQTSYPQWRGTSNIKAPYLAENLEWLKQKVDNINISSAGSWHWVSSAIGVTSTFTRTNDKGKTIFVAVTTGPAGYYNYCHLEVRINGQLLLMQSDNNVNWSKVCGVTFPVGPGQTYSIKPSAWRTGKIYWMWEFY